MEESWRAKIYCNSERLKRVEMFHGHVAVIRMSSFVDEAIFDFQHFY